MSFATARLEYAPERSPQDPPAPTEWVPLGRVMEANFTRGRRSETEVFEPGSGTFVLDDPDSSIFLAGVNGDAGPLTPVRLVVTRGGVDRVRFTGYLTEAPTPIGTREGRRASCTVTDWLGWAASVPMPTSKWATWIARNDPVAWYQSDAEGGSPLNADLDDRIINKGTAGAAGDIYATADPYTGYPIYLDANEATPVPGEDGFMWSSGWAGTREPLTYGGAYTVMFWMKVGTPAAVVLFSLTDTPFDFTPSERTLTVSMTSNGRINAFARTAGGVTISAQTALGADHGDFEPHLVIVRVNSTSLSIVTDISSGSASTGTAMASGGYLCFNSSANISWWWTDFVILNEVISTSILPLLWVDAEGGALWYMQDAATRTGYLIDAATVPAPDIEDHANGGLLALDLQDFGGTLGAAITDTAARQLGAVWVTRDGALRVRDFAALDDPDLAEHYAERLASLTDVDIDHDAYATWDDFEWGVHAWAWPDLPIVRRKPAGTTAGRVDRVINEVRIVDRDGFPLVARDDASRAKYGPRVLEVETDVPISSAGLRPALADILDRYAEPPLEIGTVTVWVWGRPEAADLVLAAELERVVHYHETGPSSATAPGEVGETLIDGTFRIQSETWSWVAGTHWTVVYTITAA